MKEKGDASGLKIKPFYDRDIAAIRAIDPHHELFLDGNRFVTDFSAFVGLEPFPISVFAAHDYMLPGYVYGGPYPGVTRVTFYDRGYVEESFLRRTEFMRQTDTPIWIGEF